MQIFKIFFLMVCLIGLVGCSARPRHKKIEASVANFKESGFVDVSKYVAKKGGHNKDVSQYQVKGKFKNTSAVKVAPSKAVLGKNPDKIFVDKTSPSRQIASVGDGLGVMPATRFTKEFATYNGEDGDTFMLVAFKLYGNYRLWQRLAKANPDLDPDQSLAGKKIRYPVPAEKFVWEKKGDPYLIRQGDTLGKISRHVYKTPRHWEALWENNQPMIQDPNLIFSGFTLYYLPSSAL
jgi:nucleoid-associated protein YgaU